jgi:hypothetical protein
MVSSTVGITSSHAMVSSGGKYAHPKTSLPSQSTWAKTEFACVCKRQTQKTTTPMVLNDCMLQKLVLSGKIQIKANTTCPKIIL